MLSETFIHDFASKNDWVLVLRYQNCSEKFLSDHSNYFNGRQGRFYLFSSDYDEIKAQVPFAGNVGGVQTVTVVVYRIEP